MCIIKFAASILTGLGVLIICLILTAGVVYFYIKQWKSRQWLNCLPGLFTSLGLLGTFCALCNSLDAINMDNLDITQMIRCIIPAFTSSISGLFCSFVATLITKAVYAWEDTKLEKKTDNLSPEEFFYGLLTTARQISDQQSQQINLIVKLSQQLADDNKKNNEYQEKLNSTLGEQSQILEQFINDFVDRMDSVFNHMHAQMEQNIKDFGEEQFKNCADTLQTLTAQLSTISTGILQSQESNVKQMVIDTNASLSMVSETVTNKIADLCDQMSTTLSHLTAEQGEKLQSMLSSYDALSTRLSAQNNEFAEKMNEKVNEEYSKIQEHNVHSLQQMSDLGEAYVEVNKNMMQSISELNQEVSDSLRDNLNDFVQELHESILSGVDQLKKSYDYISDHVANIKGNYESAVNAYSDAVNNAHRLNETQENVLSSIDESMQHIGATNEKVEEMVELLKNRQEHIDSLIIQINEIGSAIVSLQKLENQLNRIAIR